MRKDRSQEQQQQPAKTPSKAAGEQSELHDSELPFIDEIRACHQSEIRRLRKAISRSRRQMACRKGRDPFLKLLGMRRHLLQQQAQLLDYLAMAAPAAAPTPNHTRSLPMSTFTRLALVVLATTVTACKAPAPSINAASVDQVSSTHVVCERYADLQPIGAGRPDSTAKTGEYCYPIHIDRK
ncbi:hypothetical protein [Stenotrophomonas sp. STK17_22]|uniref:hypothetical protein n=1 Tax=Stenotrophomonas sp. STK17_22 TaxID=3455201 RepID=UPI003F81F493